jgi:hypothetical protein
MDIVLKSLRNGKYENEEIFDVLDLYFKQLQNQILQISTVSTTPSATNDTLPEEIKEWGNALSIFKKSLN